VQQPIIREIGLPNLLWLLRRIEVAKKSTPTTASRRAAVADDEDEDEEEVVVASPKKKATAAAPAKSATNGRANGKSTAKATVAKKPAKATDEEGAYVPNTNSMRDFIMRAMKRGGSAAEIKSRAARLAERKGVEDLSDAKAYKNFDVAFYAKFLKGKGFNVTIDEEGDSYTLNT
jgi:hypothetical protein